MLRAAGHFSAESAAREEFSGYDSALWISDLLKNYDEKIDDVIGLFETFQQVLFSGSRMYASYAPDYAEDSVRKMIGALGKEDFHRSVVHYPLFEDDCVGIVIPSQVSYSATSFALDDLSDRIILPEPAENSDPSWFGFLISMRPESGLKRQDVVEYIESHNIQTRLLFSGNIIKQPCFDDIRNTDAYRVSGELTNTDFIMENTFWVGVYPGMTDQMIDYMAQVIREAVR